MKCDFRKHRQELINFLSGSYFERVAVIERETGTFQMYNILEEDGVQEGNFRDYVITLAGEAQKEERKRIIPGMAVPKVEQALTYAPQGYCFRYQLDVPEKKRIRNIFFKAFDENYLLAAFADEQVVREEANPTGDEGGSEQSQEEKHIWHLFEFLMEEATDQFFSVDVKDHTCKVYHSNAEMEHKGSYEEQIQWFAEHKVLERERERFLKKLSFSYVLDELRRNKGFWQTSCRVIYRDGQHGLRINCRMVQAPDGREYIYFYTQDVSEMKQQEEKNRQLVEISQKLLSISQNDGLTGLFNRTAAEKDIAEALQNASEECPGTLILIDVDNFKYFNDSYGHTIGDVVLKHVAESMRKNFRSNDILCRWGGDEFLIFMRGTGNKNSIRARLERLRLSVRNIVHEGEPLHITLSIGVSIASGGILQEDWFNHADSILYEVKNRGKDNYEIREY